MTPTDANALTPTSSIAAIPVVDGSAAPAWPAMSVPAGAGSTGSGRPGSLGDTSGSKTSFKKPSRSKRQASQRNLVLFWSMYLLVSWAFITKMQIRTDTNMVRGMVISAMLGLMVLWPVYRLSQELVFPMEMTLFTKPLTGGRLARRIAREVWLDWLCLILVFQAVLWPLRIHANWSVDQTLWLGLAMAVWSLLSGAVTAWGCRWNCHVHRAVATLICLFMVVGEPVILWLANVPSNSVPLGWRMVMSPVELIWSMSQQPMDWTPVPWMGRIAGVGIAAVVAWLLLVLVPLPESAGQLNADGSAKTDCGCVGASVCGIKTR